jgi:8-oxo-dGTP pyrophosphatase MutT (NUDIX family)
LAGAETYYSRILGCVGFRKAAVLVPVFRDGDGRLRLVLVVRSDHGIHGGQLGFPGGAAEPGDAGLVETALRETEEEIGLVRDDVEVLAALDPIESHVSSFEVHPFLARVPPDARWRLQADEIVGLLTPAVEELALPEARRQLPFSSASIPEMLVDGIPVEDHVLWGLTLRMLDPLIPRLLAGEWTI